jgi:hypothetical protein
MAPQGHCQHKTKQLTYLHREQPAYEEGSDPRKPQFNTGNLSSTQLAPNMADSVSEGGMTGRSGSWVMASDLFSSDDAVYSNCPSEEMEFELNYTVTHQAPSYQTLDTAGTGQTERAVRDSTDGRRLSSQDLPRRDSFVLVEPDDASARAPSPSASPPVEFGRVPLNARTLHHFNKPLANGYTDDLVFAWAREAEPTYTARMVKQASTDCGSPSRSSRSSVVSQSWVWPPVPAPGEDTTANYMAMGAWQPSTSY